MITISKYPNDLQLKRMMEDIRSDKTIAHKQKSMAYRLAYVTGGLPPNYPMPATTHNATVACTHRDAALCGKYRLGYVALMEVFIDARI